MRQTIALRYRWHKRRSNRTLWANRPDSFDCTCAGADCNFSRDLVAYSVPVTLIASIVRITRHRTLRQVSCCRSSAHPNRSIYEIIGSVGSNKINRVNRENRPIGRIFFIPRILTRSGSKDHSSREKHEDGPGSYVTAQGPTARDRRLERSTIHQDHSIDGP